MVDPEPSDGSNTARCRQSLQTAAKISQTRVQPLPVSCSCGWNRFL
jgi:hypothetical protein